MNRLLIVPILLWAGLIAHAQSNVTPQTPVTTRDDGDVSSSYNSFISEPGTDADKESSESNALQEKVQHKKRTLPGLF